MIKEKDFWRLSAGPRSPIPPGFLVQPIKFGLVGILNTLVDAGLYLLLSRWLLVLPEQRILVKGISYFAGILNSYCWNRSWTFRKQHAAAGRFVPFVLVNLTGLALNAGLMHVGLEVLAIPEFGSLVLATLGTFLWNFALSKHIVFK